MRVIEVISIVSLIVVPLGCSNGGAEMDRADRWTADTTATGTVMVMNSESGTWRAGEAWQLREDLRIGSVDGKGPDIFGQIVALAADDSGRIYVLDRQAREVRVFDSDGEHLRTLGGPGGGPGEFRNPFGLALAPGGGLWVVDPGNDRYTVFSGSGEQVVTHRRPVAFFTAPWPGGFGRDGSLYDVAIKRGLDPNSSSEILVRIGEALEPVDTVIVPWAKPEQITVRRPDGTPVMSLSNPFNPGLVWRFDPRGFIWSAMTGRYEIRQQTLDGDTVRIIRRHHTGVPVSPQERDSALNAIRSRIASAGFGARADRDPQVPAHKPPLKNFYVDDEGYVWVELSRQAGMPITFDVFDPQGKYLGAVRSPVEIAEFPAPLFTRNAVYAMVSDSLGVPYVVRLDIQGRQ